MIAYKGFTKNLTARLGRGEYQFEIGKTAVEESSKTVRNGFHCCENPFECLRYYKLNDSDRFFQVLAAGSIDEDDDERIACTELTLLKELNVKEFAMYGMMYMVSHPKRENWKQSYDRCCVAAEHASAKGKGYIAIARGESPRVKGVTGSILGIIVEPEPGHIAEAKLFVCTKEQSGKWYTLDGNRTLVEWSE